eukprot:4175782-Prymnesium_polylepis.1
MRAPAGWEAKLQAYIRACFPSSPGYDASLSCAYETGQLTSEGWDCEGLPTEGFHRFDRAANAFPDLDFTWHSLQSHPRFQQPPCLKDYLDADGHIRRYNELQIEQFCARYADRVRFAVYFNEFNWVDDFGGPPGASRQEVHWPPQYVVQSGDPAFQAEPELGYYAEMIAPGYPASADYNSDGSINWYDQVIQAWRDTAAHMKLKCPKAEVVMNHFNLAHLGEFEATFQSNTNARNRLKQRLREVGVSARCGLSRTRSIPCEAFPSS